MNWLKKAAVGFLQDPASSLWQFWGSQRLSWALIGLALVAGLAALIFPQRPAGIEGDPIAYGRWLADVRSQLGERHELVRSLGLLDVAHSLGLRFLLGALGLNAIICLAENASRLSTALRHERTAIEIEESQKWRVAATTSDPIPRLRAYLESRSWTVLSSPNDEPSVVAWRFPWRSICTLLVYSGLLLGLVGLAANARWGWQETNLTAGNGQVLSLEHDKSIEVRNDGVHVDSESSSRSSSDQSANLTVLRSGHDEVQLRLNGSWPRYLEGLLFRLTGYGPSILIDAVGSDGQPATLSVQPTSPAGDASAELRFRDTGDEGYLLVPSADLTFRLTYYSISPWQDVEGPILHVQAIRSGQVAPVWETSVQGNGAWSYQGIAFHTRSHRYAILRIDYVPGLPMSSAGVLLAFVGLISLSLSPPVYSIRASYDQGECALLFDAVSLARGPIAKYRLARFRRDIQIMLSA